jgi:PKD domain
MQHIIAPWRLFLALIILGLAACNKEEDAGPKPTADFIFQVESGNQAKVNFASTSQGAEFLVWDFGDRLGRAFSASASYEYTQSGTYTVSLTASNKAGIATKYATVTVAVPPRITSAFEVNFANINSSLQVNVVNKSANAASFRWDWNDGSSSTAAEPGSHTYAEPGVYEILLEAIDANGVIRDRQRTQVRVLDDRDLYGGMASREWGYRAALLNGRTGYYVVQNGAVAYDNALLDCELNDRFRFAQDGAYSNNNEGDARLFSQGGQCRDRASRLPVVASAHRFDAIPLRNRQ